MVQLCAHNKMTSARVLIAALLLSGAAAHAQTACFDDRYPGDVGNLTAPGLTITASGIIWGGVSNGDPGNWDLDGTCGPAFLGVNSGSGDVTTFNLSPSTNSFSVDIGIPGTATNVYTITAFNGTTQVAQRTLSITGNGSGTGTWATTPSISGVGAITSVQVTATSVQTFWGFDNVQYALAPVVVPSTAAAPIPTLNEWGVIILSSLLAMFGIARARRKK